MFGEKDSEEVLNSYRKIYYQLKKDIYFVPGVKGAAICDTTTGKCL